MNEPGSGDADYAAGNDAKRDMARSRTDQRVMARRQGREDAQIIAVDVEISNLTRRRAGSNRPFGTKWWLSQSHMQSAKSAICLSCQCPWWTSDGVNPYVSAMIA